MWKNALSMKEERLTVYLFELELAKALGRALPDSIAAGLALAPPSGATSFRDAGA